MATSNAPNRRRTTRSSLRFGAEARGRVRVLRDLSLDGAFLEAERAAPGEQIDLAVRLDDGKPPMEARAVVVRETAEGAGVRFVGLRTRDMVRIAEKIFGDN
jgi:hypothetical protein